MTLELLALPASARLCDAIQPAVAFLMCCADPDLPGAFRFYPLYDGTPRLQLPLHADLDDTALASTALFRAGFMTADRLRHDIPRLAAAIRIPGRRGDEPPWVISGLAMTWFGPPPSDNPIDLVVNTNLLALETLPGLDDQPAHRRRLPRSHRGRADDRGRSVLATPAGTVLHRSTGTAIGAGTRHCTGRGPSYRRP